MIGLEGLANSPPVPATSSNFAVGTLTAPDPMLLKLGSLLGLLLLAANVLQTTKPGAPQFATVLIR